MSIVVSSNKLDGKAKYRDLNFMNDHNTNLLHVDDYLAIRNSIRNILFTKKGSRVLDPEFGSNVEEYLFQELNNDNAVELAEHLERSLEQEPRIDVQDIIIEIDEENSAFGVVIVYTIPSLDSTEIKASIGLDDSGLVFNHTEVNKPSHFDYSSNWTKV